MKALASCVVLVAALSLPAQGGIRWSDNLMMPETVVPVLRVRELAPSGTPNQFFMCSPGWTTTSFPPLGGAGQGVGIRIPPVVSSTGSVTILTVQSEESATEQQTEAIAFVFTSNANVIPIFCATPLCTSWTGFFAPPAVGVVPSYARVALCFRVTFSRPVTLDNLVMNLTPSIGLAHATQSGIGIGRVFTPTLPFSVQPADIVDYRFDRGVGRTAINYAGVGGGAPAQGQMLGPAPWTAGRSGSALAAGNTCDTGWTGDLGGSFSIGWFMQGPATTAETPLFRLGMPPPVPTFRCFTGGPAGDKVRCAFTGSGPGGVTTTTAIQTLAAAGWVHVALVVDDMTSSATWYVNGTAELPAISLPGRPSIAAGTATLQIGSLITGYAIDEFRMVARPVSAAEILTWVNGSPAKTITYSATCGANLRTNGLPSLGNGALQIRVEGAPGSFAAVTLGATPYLLGTIQLPIDLRLISPAFPVCQWYSDLTISLPLPLSALGLGDLGLPIPNDSALRGLDLDAQALVVEPTLVMRATNALVLAID